MPTFHKNSFFLFIFFLLLFLSLFIFQNKVKNFTYFIFSPFQKFFWNFGRATANVLSFFIQVSNKKEELSQLQKENLKLKTEIEKLKEAQKENEILKKALQLQQENFKILPARIISKDTEEDVLIIDKGKKDGVFEGEVVITPEKVLVGKIIKTYDNFSKVAILSYKNFTFNGEILDKKINILLEGRGNLRLYLTFLPKEKNIEIGDKISSSALGGKFPPGFFIGEIESIEKLSTKAYQEAKIKLGFSLSDLEFVFLISNFQPWKES